MVLSATTTEQLQDILHEDRLDFRYQCGYNKPINRITIDDKHTMVRSIWLHFVLFQPHAELEQLREGLGSTLQVEHLMRNYSKEMWGLLASSNAFNVTPQFLCDSFVIHYSDNGSNNRTHEEAVVYMWFEYITDSCDESAVKIGEILQFMSGSSKLPATGFDAIPTIHFTDSDQLPKVSTCDISIMFSRKMGNLTYEQFSERMTFAILGSKGFGLV